MQRQALLKEFSNLLQFTSGVDIDFEETLSNLGQTKEKEYLKALMTKRMIDPISKALRYQGTKGLLEYCDRYFVQNLQYAQNLARKLLSVETVKALAWPKTFLGSPSEFRGLPSKILGTDEGATFSGQDGYVRFADNEEFQGAMQKAYQQVSAVLSKAEFTKLDWQMFPGSTAEFRSLRSKILGTVVANLKTAVFAANQLMTSRFQLLTRY